MVRHVGLTVSVTMLILLLFFSSTPAAAQSGRTFYIDYASGSNNNPGTKQQPWKSHPYMNCSSGSHGGWSHQAGDQYIFKGGVTWPVACFTLVVRAGGTSTARDYYGVDQTWYNGGSWTRPLWDMGYNAPSASHVVEAGLANNATYPNSLNSFYITFDNIEIAHELWSFIDAANQGNCFEGTMLLFTTCGGSGWNIAAASNFITVQNMYIHDCHVNDAPTTTPAPGIGAIFGGAICGIAGATTVANSEISNVNGQWQGNSDEHGSGCIFCGEFKGNKVHDLNHGVHNLFGPVHDNEFYHIGGSNVMNNQIGGHVHVIFFDPFGGDCGGSGTTNSCPVYNNAIHDVFTGTGNSYYCCGLVANVPYNTAVFNNVIWNFAGDPAFSIFPPCDAGTSTPCDSSSDIGYIYNNTVYCPTTGPEPVLANDAKPPTMLGTLYIQNNLSIPG